MHFNDTNYYSLAMYIYDNNTQLFQCFFFIIGQFNFFKYNIIFQNYLQKWKKFNENWKTAFYSLIDTQVDCLYWTNLFTENFYFINSDLLKKANFKYSGLHYLKKIFIFDFYAMLRGEAYNDLSFQSGTLRRQCGEHKKAATSPRQQSIMPLSKNVWVVQLTSMRARIIQRRVLRGDVARPAQQPRCCIATPGARHLGAAHPFFQGCETQGRPADRPQRLCGRTISPPSFDLPCPKRSTEWTLNECKVE